MSHLLLAIALLLSRAGEAAVDLAQAYRAALEKTEPVALERSRLLQAEEREDQATGALFPQISLSGRYTRQDVSFGGTNAAFTNPNQYSVSLGATQALFRGLAEFGELRRQGALVAAQTAQEHWSRRILMRDVAGRFYGVLAAERDLDTLKTLSQLTAKRLDELKGRVRIGRSRQGELLAAESQEALQSSQIQGAENELVRAREAFALATGLPAGADLAPAGDDPPPAPGPVEKALADAAKRPDLQALQAQVDAADAGVTVARGGHFPSVDLSANYYLTRTGVLANSKWDAGVSFTFPIFRGGAVSSAVGEAAQARKEAELGLARARREAENEIRTLTQRLTSLLQQVKSLRRAAALAEKNYRTQNRDYGFGLVTNLEVLQALNTYQETRRVLDRTFFDALSTRVSLDVAVGAVIPETGKK